MLLNFFHDGVNAEESPSDTCLLQLQNLFLESVVLLMRFCIELSNLLYMEYYVGNAGIIRLFITFHDYVFCQLFIVNNLVSMMINE